MFIQDIPYVRIGESGNFSAAASLWMLLSHYVPLPDPQTFTEMYCHLFLSDEFHSYSMNNIHSVPGEIPQSLLCCMYMVNEAYSFCSFRAGLISTDIGTIRYSFLKRRIPVLLSGRFPSSSDYLQNTILLKGYVDDYFVVNDPRGDANSKYMELNGENHLYHVNHLNEWFQSRETVAFRISVD